MPSLLRQVDKQRDGWWHDFPFMSKVWLVWWCWFGGGLHVPPFPIIEREGERERERERKKETTSINKETKKERPPPNHPLPREIGGCEVPFLFKTGR